ncbi:MAG: hypothetical protein ACLT9P_01480 [Evtepia gabavorous]
MLFAGLIGQVGNIDHENISIATGPEAIPMGWEATVRGSIVNPNDTRRW